MSYLYRSYKIVAYTKGFAQKIPSDLEKRVLNLLIDFYEHALFENTNYQVSQNNRFKGGHIIKPKVEKNSVETCIIEIKTSCFINPDELDKGRVPSPVDNIIEVIDNY